MRQASVPSPVRMPWWQRIVLVQWFLLALLAGSVMLGLGVLAAVIFIRSLSA